MVHTLTARGDRGAVHGRSPAARRDGLPLEMRLVLACATSQLDPAGIAALRSGLHDGPDWDRLIELSSWHRTVPLTCRALHEHAPDLTPSQLLETLSSWTRANAQRALVQTMDLLRIIDSFERAGIAAVPYKGPALSALLYDNVALRPAGDIDIVVGQEEVGRARAVLLREGYEAKFPVSASGLDFLIRNRYSENFVRAQHEVVELHWRFTNADIGIPLTLDDLRGRLRAVRLGDRDVPCFSPEDLILILCIHGAKHCWERVEWITCVAEAIRRAPGLRWSDLLARAAVIRAEKTLLLGLELAGTHLGAPLPESIRARIREIPDIKPLTRRVAAKLAERGAPTRVEGADRDLFRLQLQHSIADKVRYLAHRIVVPARADTKRMLPLGSRSIPLEALLRPVRITWRALSVGARLLVRAQRRRW